MPYIVFVTDRDICVVIFVAYLRHYCHNAGKFQFDFYIFYWYIQPVFFLVFMKKIIILLFLWNSICFSVSFKTGYTKTYQYFKDYNIIYSNNHTLNIGAGFSFDLNDVYSLNFDTIFNFSNYCKKFLNEYNATIKQTPIVSFELPFYLKIVLDDKFNLLFGVYAWIPLKKSYQKVDFESNEKTLTIEYNNFISGGIFAGLEYKIDKISFEIRYKYGFKTFYEKPVVYDNDFSLFFNVEF